MSLSTRPPRSLTMAGISMGQGLRNPAPHLGGLRTLRAAGCWAPGSFKDDGQVGSGEPSVRASWAEIHLLSWAGHWRDDLG